MIFRGRSITDDLAARLRACGDDGPLEVLVGREVQGMDPMNNADTIKRLCDIAANIDAYYSEPIRAAVNAVVVAGRMAPAVAMSRAALLETKALSLPVDSRNRGLLEAAARALRSVK